MSAPTLETPTAPTPATPTTPALVRGTDRCDRCGAEAFVLVLMPSGKDLLFCGHHFSQHESVLKDQQATVVADKRAEINTAPSVSANAV